MFYYIEVHLLDHYIQSEENEVAHFIFKVLKVYLTVSQVNFFSQKHVANLLEMLHTVWFSSRKNLQ
jgi:hypothetical protein